MKRILCFGDSNTYGFDGRSYIGSRYPETVRWTAVLKERGWDIVNEGVSGREIPALDSDIAQAVQTVEEAGPLDLMVIMLGGNDLLQYPGFTAQDVADRMEHFLEHLHERLPDLPVLLLPPVPMQRGAWVGEERLLVESAHLCDRYQHLSERLGVFFADTSSWNVKLAFDGVHFSEAGHVTFAERMHRLLLADCGEDD